MSPPQSPPSSSRPPHLLPPQRAHFHPLWLERLRYLWHQANRTHLGAALQPPVLMIDVQSHAVLGRWRRQVREISISEAHILAQPWHEVEDTLYHEMAHQFADEVLQAHGETAHGPAFAEGCRRLRVAARASAQRGPLQDAADKVLNKVKKLLALAESQNVHEAEAAMANANRLLLMHNLDLAQAHQRSDYRTLRVGATMKTVGLPAKLVSAILTEFFFVDAVWVSAYDALTDDNRRQLQLLGSDTNLDLAHYVHDFLYNACQRLWKEQARQHSGRTARREFAAGVLLGFRDKLRAERKVSQDRGLVWIGDRGLEEFVAAEHPHLRSMTRSTVGHTSALSAGRAAGQELRLHRGVHSSTHSGKLLGR